jgi:flagellar biosynthesis protein FliR
MPMLSLVFSQADIVRFGIVLFRVAGVMTFAPFFSSGAVSYQVRIALTLTATLAMAPSVSPGLLPSDLSLGTLLGVVMGEIAFGMMLGLVASFIFAGLQLAGQLAAFQLGFSIVNLIDPQSEVETSVVSFLYYYLGILLFLLINGHHWFFLAVGESFNYLPVQGITLHAPVINELVRLSSRMFVAGLQIAAPVLAMTIITDIVLGILGRAAPQINILIVSLPLKSLVGFAALSISFYFLPQLLGKYYLELHHDLFALLHRMV